MKALRTILRELLGLVVDDAGLAIGLLVWCAVMAVLIHGLALQAGVAALLLAAGCLLILFASVRQARRR